MISSDQRLSRLAYVSAAARPLSRDELIDIGETAKKNNQDRRVTGMLLHVENEFFQVLEGPSAAVEQIFGRIAQDPRNRWVTPLLRERPFFRVFKTWSMGCFDLPFDNLPQDVFFKAEWEEVKLRMNADRRHAFYRFLERFYEVNLEAGRAATF